MKTKYYLLIFLIVLLLLGLGYYYSEFELKNENLDDEYKTGLRIRNYYDYIPILILFYI
jgi:hypothetical protein